MIAYNDQYKIQDQIPGPLVAGTAVNPISGADTPALDILKSFMAFDEAVFKRSNETQDKTLLGPYHGQICMTLIEETPGTAPDFNTGKYEALVLVNITSS